MMIKSILIVGFGSFLGGSLRYSISMLMRGCCTEGFPWGTLTMNLVGCFTFGVINALFQRMGASNNPWFLLLTTGLCGGFTTFSTFANESVLMLQSGNIVGFAKHIASSIILGLVLVVLGYYII